MHPSSFALVCCCLVGVAVAQEPVTFASLLKEMVDLDRLTRLPDPDYRTVQFSSTDRRSKSPDEPGWFANADGFGQEPIPGFEKVLREPDADGVGEYLICDVDGPGAIVRGWSAGMDGVLRVWLDGGDKPLFEGKGYDFLARRSSALVAGFAKLDENVRALLQQQDADYLPIPFARHLRVAWTGRIRDLHFYHLQVRCYAAGTAVTFTAADAAAVLAWTLPDLARTPTGGERTAFRIEPGKMFTVTREAPAGERRVLRVHASRVLERDAGGGVIEPKGDGLHVFPAGAQLRWLGLRLEAATPGALLRAVVLRVFADGSQVPQVEAPLGDFFGSSAGVHRFASLPITVTADAGFVCRWPMPYARSMRLELANLGTTAVAGELAQEHGPLESGFDDKTLYFHALWRADHQLSAQAAKAPIDLPYLTAIGQGRFCGVACQIVNPPMDPRWRSNWWGEGDEKIFVDGKLAALGTGSEDYFNYSWSHWRYFAHPYCGQPLSTGPGNCGYVSNYRCQILDDLPFAQSFAMAMELWSHKPVSPLSYSRITYFYARPGVVTDHRAIQPADLVLPALAPWKAEDFTTGGDAIAWLPNAVADGWHASAGNVTRVSTALLRSGAILQWEAPAGAELALPFSVPKDASYRLRACCRQRPDAPSLQARVDDTTLRDDGKDTFPLTCVHGERFEDLVFDDVTLAQGPHTLVLVCPQGGSVGVDLCGYELRAPAPKQLPGAVEGELMDVVGKSPGLDVEVQGMGSNDWSGMHQRWIKATKPGDFATFRVAAPRPGRYRVTLRLTKSWDYGILHVEWNGERACADVDTFCGEPRALSVSDVDLGERELDKPAELKLTVVGHNEKSVAPHCYFGVDCVVLTAK